MSESEEKLMKAIKHYQDSLDRHSKTGNSEKLLHAIEKLSRLPIRLSHLRETGIGRTVNSLKRFEGSVGNNAKTLVEKWKLIAQIEEDEERRLEEQQQQEEAMENEVAEDEPDPESLHIAEQELEDSDKSCKVENNNSSHRKSSSSHRSSHNSSSSNRDRRSRSRDKYEKSSSKRHHSSNESSDSDSRSRNKSKKHKSESKSRNKDYSDKESESSDSDRSRSNSSSSSSSNESSDSDSERSNSEESSSSNSDDGKRHKHDKKSKRRRSSTTESDISDSKVAKSGKHGKTSSESEKDSKAKHTSKSRDRSKDRHSSSSNSKSKDKSDKHKSNSSKKDTSSSYNSKSKSSERTKHDLSEKEKSKSRYSNIDSKRPEKNEDKKGDDSKKESSKSRSSSKSSHDRKKPREPSPEKHRSTSSKSSYHKNKPKESSLEKNSDDRKKSREASLEKESRKHKYDSSDSKSSKHSSRSREKESSNRKKHDDSRREKDKRDKSETEKSNNSKPKEKEKSTPTKKSSQKLLNGIDSGSGTSFADVLGMLEAPPVYKGKKKSIGGEDKSNSSSSSAISKNRSSADGSSSVTDNGMVPILLKDPGNLEPLDLNISSLLPTITPNYRPLGTSLENHGGKKVWNDEEALTKVISAKHQRTKVFSGNRSLYATVPSLFELCSRILQDNLDALEYTGGVPYSILKPILEKANPDQLYQLEFHNPYLIEDTDELWQLHCQKEFRNKRREELESWREMYLRCLDEREAKLKALTANIKQSQDNSVPVRQTKLAYVDSVAKPPRNIARKQAKNGTAADLKRPSQTPTERLNQLAKTEEAAKVAVPNPARAASNRSSSSSSHLKPKKAPLMAKTLSLLKNRFGRR